MIINREESPAQRSQRFKSGSTNMKSLTLKQRIARVQLTEKHQNEINVSVPLEQTNASSDEMLPYESSHVVSSHVIV
jgi:hypothetical protein